MPLLDPQHDVVAIDAIAEWIDAGSRADAWEQIKAVEPPVGFDPAMIWPDGPESADCGFLRFEAHRVIATRAAQAGLIWSR